MMRFAILAIGMVAAAISVAGCSSYDVPGGDRPWPALTDVPARPDPGETDRRRRKLYEKYGDLENALPAAANQPARPPAGALQVAVIQFPKSESNLDAAALEILTQVAAYAKQARAEVYLFGYTSIRLEVPIARDVAKPARALAARRLHAVGLALARGGVPIERLHPVARGNLEPAWQETEEAGQEGNRRVEIWFAR